jgi:hypothetical protein
MVTAIQVVYLALPIPASPTYTITPNDIQTASNNIAPGPHSQLTLVTGSNTRIPYNPLFTSMCKQGSIDGVFALAVNRNTPTLGNAGYRALGGIPPVAFHAPMVSSKIVPYEGESDLTLYNIVVSGISYEAGDYDGPVKSTPHGGMSPYSNTSAAYNSSSFIATLDSGTNAFYLPEAQAVAINSLFRPPAMFDPIYQVWWVNCSAIPPKVGLNIAQMFDLNPIDLIQHNGDGTCWSTVRIGSPGVYLLGIQFFYNTLVAFDVEAGYMRIAARQWY